MPPLSVRPDGLYHTDFEKASCGFGLIANLDNRASHWLVRTGIQSLSRLTHRGATASDGKTGDGCGLLFKKPDAFLRAAALENGIGLTPWFGVGQLFLSKDESLAERALAQLKTELEREGFRLAGFRPVPINPEACGEMALQTLPRIVQVFVNASSSQNSRDPEDEATDILERRLFMARRRTEKALAAVDCPFYACSLSGRVLIYKGMITPDNLPVFYPDLIDERFESSLCLYHQRFSTNTWPEWRLAQPFRYLAHNGEINTISGNRHWAASRGTLLASPLIPDLADALPVGTDSGSDSMSLDNLLETLVIGGLDLRLAIRILTPPAWQNMDAMDPQLRALYEYYSLHMDSWEGPAALVLTDGRRVVATTDRNGLRPARWVMTEDRHFTIASEIGVYDYDPLSVIAKGRLGPGKMLCLDLDTGELWENKRIDDFLKSRQPYHEWLDTHIHPLKASPAEDAAESDPLPAALLPIYEKEFLVTQEERTQVLRVLAETAQEAVGSMGDDTALPVLSNNVRSLYESFRQQFAQVTNPPIDALREITVMSLRTALGREKNPFDEAPEHASRINLYSPVLSRSVFLRLQAMQQTTHPEFTHEVIDLTYSIDGTLPDALESICRQAVQAVQRGKVFLILSDRGIAEDRLPIHALLATGAVHHRLSAQGLRCNANLIVETATVRDPHHMAVLIGCGATAVYPYLAYRILTELACTGASSQKIRNKTPGQLIQAYRRGIDKGLFKILSKMGISTINSYRGTQLFEAVGLHDSVVECCFPGLVSRIQGMGFEEIEADQRLLHREAWNPVKPVRQGGLLKFTPQGEYHAFNPDVVMALQQAAQSGSYADYQEYADRVNRRPPMVLRDLLRLAPSAPPIALEDVEPVEAIMQRFDTAAMSLGSLSPEAHEAMAIAMNRIGGRSNSGEGGEDPTRYGTEKVSRIKQIASGRFGVTPAYLVNADVLQIKIAQGAKPGEGGQLPAHKVTELIAQLRCTLPGTPLISPPPHHDIYSIEDLAQLIFDLKQVNPQAMVSVKLVSEPGIGTVAAGVVKTGADLITVAGYDGGTGASPITSVKYAGCPWELGLAETQQVLRANNLRGKVRIQVDGGLKTGLDVVKAAILGAESFGFGTAPLIALGCKYLRICHLNNCATGVATQNPTLRLHHFQGSADRVVNYFRLVAEEVRHWLAQLGARNLTDIIGRTELLEQMEGSTPKQRRLDLSPLLSRPSRFGNAGETSDATSADVSPRYCQVARNPASVGSVNEKRGPEKLWEDTRHAIEQQTGGIFSYTINNTDRSAGARLSGEIARRYGNHGLKHAPITIRFSGTAGQSFGAWNAGGLHLVLEGDANDYVGKGMAGGEIVIYPPHKSRFDSRNTPIMGNTCLYGATGGHLYASGSCGERFAVRNSGAIAVVEGIGNHGCEYMTGGVVAILGTTGYNFGAGMTGGFAYVLDLEESFVDRYNHELVDIHRIHTENHEEWAGHLRGLIQTFVVKTASDWGRNILHDFSGLVDKFWLVKPKATEMETLLGLINIAA